MKSRSLLFLSGWVVLGLTLLSLSISCIIPRGEGHRGGWHGGGGGQWHERG